MKKYYLFFIFLFLFAGCVQKQQPINYVKVLIPIEKTIENNVTKNNSYGGGIFWMFKMLSMHNRLIGNSRHRINKKNRLYLPRMKKYMIVHKPQAKAMEQIKYHNYSTFNSFNEVKKLKNTMTYVLFPRNLEEANKETQKYKRYAKTLEVIQELKKVNDSNSSNSLIDKYENKFILLKNNLRDTKKITVETYNYSLSNKLLDFFKEKLPPAFFDKDGPFFITVSENVFEKKVGLSDEIYKIPINKDLSQAFRIKEDNRQ